MTEHGLSEETIPSYCMRGRTPDQYVELVTDIWSGPPAGVEQWKHNHGHSMVLIGIDNESVTS